MDKKAKLWSFEGNKPSMVAARQMSLGAIFDLRFSRECPALLAAGGSLGKLGVWNTLETQAMQARSEGDTYQKQPYKAWALETCPRMQGYTMLYDQNTLRVRSAQPLAVIDGDIHKPSL